MTLYARIPEYELWKNPDERIDAVKVCFGAFSIAKKCIQPKTRIMDSFSFSNLSGAKLLIFRII